MKCFVITVLLLTSFPGCGKLWAIDGNWKLRYPVCMFSVPKEVQAFSGELQYVDTCPNAPVTGMAFCAEHCTVMEKHRIPCKLQDYLSYKKDYKLYNTGIANMTAADCQGI